MSSWDLVHKHHIDVALLDAGLVRRAALFDAADQRPDRRAELEAVGEFAGNLLDHNADPPPLDTTTRLELPLYVHGHIDGNGEGQTHETARPAVDLRIDSNHFTFHVEQRTARIARIDRHVGLDEGHEIFLRQRAPLGADDTCRHRILETEGRANGHDPVANPQPARITQRHPRQSARIDLEERHVGARIGTDQARGEFALVGELDDDLVGPLDHMGIGEDIAVSRNDETRPERTTVGLGSRRARSAGYETPEEVEHGVVFFQARNTLPLTAGLGRADIDHRRALALGQIGKIGQIPGVTGLRDQQGKNESQKTENSQHRNGQVHRSHTPASDAGIRSRRSGKSTLGKAALRRPSSAAANPPATAPTPAERSTLPGDATAAPKAAPARRPSTGKA